MFSLNDFYPGYFIGKMSALRARAERGWALLRAPDSSESSFFRYVKIRNLPGIDKPGRADFSGEPCPSDFPRHASPGERGAWAERLASGYLCNRGLTILAKNYRCRSGEIDLIMRQGTTTVFVEVRFRANTRFGTGLDSVDGRKKRRIVMSARHYLQQNPMLRAEPCRFDIVSISLSNKADAGAGRGIQTSIQWIPAAFDAD